MDPRSTPRASPWRWRDRESWGARYPYYTLADSPEGQSEEARLSGSEPRNTSTHRDIGQGFVYERVPHITLKAIANNTEIDTIWDQSQPAVESALAVLNEALLGHPTPYPVAHGARKRQTVDFTAPAEKNRTPERRPPRLRTASSNGRSRTRPRTTGRRRPVRRLRRSGKPASLGSKE